MEIVRRRIRAGNKDRATQFFFVVVVVRLHEEERKKKVGARFLSINLYSL